MLNPSRFLCLRSPLAAALLVVCGPAVVQGQDTIQSGSLRPLETLPSLGLPASPAPGQGLLPELTNPTPGPAPSVLSPLPGGPPGVGAVPGAGALPTLSPAPAAGALGTLGGEPVPASLGTLGTMPGLPPAGVPSVPALAAPPAAAASTPAPATPVSPSSGTTQPAAASGAPPPLPTTGPQVITGPLAQGYLYVEPYQTRFEAMFDAASMYAWLSPATPVPDTLTPEVQKDMVEKAAARAAGWCTLSSGNEVMNSSQVQVSVIKGLPGNTLPLAEHEPVAVNQAMLGFIWEFATPPAPADVSVTWNGWINNRTTLPLRVFFGTQSETGEINSTIKSYRWRNMDRLPRPAPLAAVPQWEPEPPMRVPLGGAVWLLGGLVFYVYLKIKDRKLPGGSLPYVAVWLLGAVLMSQLLVIPVHMGPARPAVTEVAEAQRIVSPLLRNVYRAFDHRSESDVYDVLERSVEGELLRRLYLETIQALTLEGREGTRVNITEFQVTVDKVAPDPSGEGFIADCNWMARGNVGHWGHTHSRLNIYNARLTLVPVKEEWKLTGLEVQEVRRL